MAISIGTLEKNITALAETIRGMDGVMGADVEVFRSGHGGYWSCSQVVLTVEIGDDEFFDFTYTANGYGSTYESSTGSDFGQNQKWSFMKTETLNTINAGIGEIVTPMIDATLIIKRTSPDVFGVL